MSSRLAALPQPSQVDPSIFDLTYDELAGTVGDESASQVFDALYRRRAPSRAVTRTCDEQQLDASPLEQLERSPGRTSTKYLFGLRDGGAIETVRIHRRDGQTACVSSQVGCGFGCRFCASGRNGLKRHLTPGEIVQQVLALGPRVNRIVFMGIGEPLHNYDNVLTAIRILRDRRGLGFKTGGITISTIGIPQALTRLREEHLKINLTVSLHATTQDTRDSLIPGARRHPIDEIISRSLSWADRHNRIVTYVYLLLPGVNDTKADIGRLTEFFAGRPARINLMRWNPVEGGATFRRIDDRGLTAARHRLLDAGIPTTVRDTQGRDIDAACGQLWLRDLSRTNA